MSTFKIGPKGKEALARGALELSPMARLILEITSRVTAITKEDAVDLAVQLVQKYGGPDAAVAALREGLVSIEPDVPLKN